MKNHARLVNLAVFASLLIPMASCERKSGPEAAQAPAMTAQAQPAAPAPPVEAKPQARLKPKPAALPRAGAAPAAPVAQQPATLTVPAHTPLSVSLTRELATDKVAVGDSWDGTLAEDVVVAGQVAWPRGTPVKGTVTQSAPAGRLQSGQGGLGIRVSTVGYNQVESGTYQVVGAKRTERDAKMIGGGAALGALVGLLTSKGHHAGPALGGAAIGAAAGTGVAAGTADTVIRIPAAKPVVFTLARAETVVLQ